MTKVDSITSLYDQVLWLVFYTFSQVMASLFK